jgi:hypothetical protein
MRPDQLIKDGDRTTCTIRHRSLDDVYTCMQAALNREPRVGSSMKGSRDFCGTASLEEYRDMLTSPTAC